MCIYLLLKELMRYSSSAGFGVPEATGTAKTAEKNIYKDIQGIQDKTVKNLFFVF